MTYLGLVQDARVACARHIGASVVGLGVPDLAPGVLHDGLAGGIVGVGHATDLAVVVEAGANGAVRNFFLVNLVAVVAIAAVDVIGFIGPSQATTTLSNFFAFFPVADELAIRGPLDGFEVGLFDALGSFSSKGLPATSASLQRRLVSSVAVIRSTFT